MKILHLVESYGGGVFTSVTQLLNAFAPHHEVTLAYSLREETPSDFKERIHPKVKLKHLNLTREISPFRDLSGLFQIMRTIREVNPDVLHLHSSKAGFLGRLAARLTGYKANTLYSPRGYSFLREDVSPKKRKVFHKLEQLASAMAGTVVGCSTGEQRAAHGMGAPATCIHNAVDLSILPVRVDRTDSRLRVGMLARVTFKSNPELFAAIADQVAKTHPEVEFIWIGGGTAGASKTALTDAKVHVTGWLPRTEALAQLASCDIYLHTSRWEGMPLAVIEAMGVGLPVVATRIIGNEDAVDDEVNGFLGTNLTDLAPALLRLIEDPVLAKRMGEQGQRLAHSRFSLPAMVQAYEGLYAAAAKGIRNNKSLDLPALTPLQKTAP